MKKELSDVRKYAAAEAHRMDFKSYSSQCLKILNIFMWSDSNMSSTIENEKHTHTRKAHSFPTRQTCLSLVYDLTT